MFCNDDNLIFAYYAGLDKSYSLNMAQYTRLGTIYYIPIPDTDEVKKYVLYFNIILTNSIQFSHFVFLTSYTQCIDCMFTAQSI